MITIHGTTANGVALGSDGSHWIPAPLAQRLLLRASLLAFVWGGVLGAVVATVVML